MNSWPISSTMLAVPMQQRSHGGAQRAMARARHLSGTTQKIWVVTPPVAQQLLPKPTRNPRSARNFQAPSISPPTQRKLLYVAARYGMNDLLDRLLFVRRIHPDSRAPGEMTPLAAAIEHGHQVAAHMLLAAGATPFGEGSMGYTNLQQAIVHGWSDVVSMLLEAGADPQGIRAVRTSTIHWGISQLTPFHIAAERRDDPLALQTLLQYCAKPSIGYHSWNLLHVALWAGNLDAIPLLLQAGQSATSKDISSCKPLSMALLLHRSLPLVRQLLEAAPPGATSFHLLNYGVLWDDATVLQTLCQARAFRFLVDQGLVDHGTGLVFAVRYSRPKALAALLALHQDYLRKYPGIVAELPNHLPQTTAIPEELEWQSAQSCQAWDLPAVVELRRQQVRACLRQYGCDLATDLA